MTSKPQSEARAIYENLLTRGKLSIEDDQYAVIKIAREDIDVGELGEPSVLSTYLTTGATYVVLRPLAEDEKRKESDHQTLVVKLYRLFGTPVEVININTLAEVILYFHVVALDGYRRLGCEDIGLFSRTDGSYFPVRYSQMSIFSLSLEGYLGRP